MDFGEVASGVQNIASVAQTDVVLALEQAGQSMEIPTSSGISYPIQITTF